MGEPSSFLPGQPAPEASGSAAGEKQPGWLSLRSTKHPAHPLPSDAVICQTLLHLGSPRQRDRPQGQKGKLGGGWGRWQMQRCCRPQLVWLKVTGFTPASDSPPLCGPGQTAALWDANVERDLQGEAWGSVSPGAQSAFGFTSGQMSLIQVPVSGLLKVPQPPGGLVLISHPEFLIWG